MEELKLALCEDDKEEQERLICLAQAGQVPVSVTAFENGEAFLKDYQPGRFGIPIQQWKFRFGIIRASACI